MSTLRPPSEHEEQAALVSLCRAYEARYPALGMAYAIPNGGARHKATAARLMAEGVRAGVPDLCIPVPRRGYHGLYIELKRTRGGRLSEAQFAYAAALRGYGHRVEVCAGWYAAWAVICDYLEIPNEVQG
jgi:hypothetical protein